MSAEVSVPMLGESVLEATVGHWLKHEGDSVAVGELLVELETEKVNAEVAADEAGVVESILHQEGDTVHPGDILAVIRGPGIGGQGLGNGAQGPADGDQAGDAKSGTPDEDGRPDDTHGATPVAQRVASGLGVDLGQVRGSGPGGRVTREDVEGYARGRTPGARDQGPDTPGGQGPGAGGQGSVVGDQGLGSDTQPPRTDAGIGMRDAGRPPADAGPGTWDAGRPETRRRMSRRRLTIARHLLEAQHNAAMLTTFNEVDMSAIMDLRKRRREAFRERHGVDLGYMPFFTKAVVAVLKVMPEVNAELRGEDLVLKHYYDVGLAIGDPEGLVVPVLRDADKLTFAQIEQAIDGFVRKARSRTLTLEDLRGGTFTITNGGVYGSLMSTPILNPPQVGILGMHKIQQRPVAVDGQVVIRPMMYLALSYDHRVVDGQGAVTFLVRVKELLEEPASLLLEG
ncbi:MAG: 2-oxoglutarate dehydrogenase complex dihydrolipoyllysine-residue succinyltransferase [Chloroflexota bacterium]